jgi:hypothetical protein
MTRHRHQWLIQDDEATCFHCGVPYNPITSKRGRNNRRRGNSHELAVARKYGGEKVGPLGLPEDIRGTEYPTNGGGPSPPSRPRRMHGPLGSSSASWPAPASRPTTTSS